MVETSFCVGIDKKIIILGLLRWCEMDFVHPHYCSAIDQRGAGDVWTIWRDLPVFQDALSGKMIDKR